MELSRVRRFKVSKQGKAFVVRVPTEVAEDMTVDEMCSADWFRIFIKAEPGKEPTLDKERVVLKFVRDGESQEPEEGDSEE